MKPTLVPIAHRPVKPTGNPLTLLGRYLNTLYYKYSIHTGLNTFTPQEQFLSNSILLFVLLLVARYSYLFVCQLVTYVL
eukprot:gene13750-9843_t